MTTVSVQKPHAGTPARTLVDRLLAAFPAITLTLVVLLFYAVEAWTRKMPWVFGDELEWTQISRAIAATGHAARRGQPTYFKSLYAYVIAPFWWIHSTAVAYAAIKYANAVIMPLAAIPTYLLARMLVTRRSAVVVALLSVAVPAMAYVTSIIPEVLFYPYYALCSWLVVRAFRSGKRLDMALAVAFVLGGFLIKEAESTTIPAAFVIAAAGLWVTGPRGRHFRRNWTRGDTIGAVVLLLGALFLFNRAALQNVTQWQFTTQYVKSRMVDLGLQAALSFTIGMGILPVIGGLASLRVRERRGDPTYRAYAAWVGASVITIPLYTSVKAAYLSTNFATLVEERNMIYLAPMMLIGSAIVLESKRLDWRVIAAASTFVAFIVLDKPFQTGFPYFEAPGFSIPAVLAIYRQWTIHDERLALLGVLAFSVAVFAARRRRGVAPIAVTLLLAWLLAGEIAMTYAIDSLDSQFRAYLPAKLDWVDIATHGQPVTYLGQELATQNGIWETEFWNRSIVHVDSLDGTATGPGPSPIPTLMAANGLLSDYQGTPYVLADSGIQLRAQVVATSGAMTLYRLHGPWHLLSNEESVYSDTWCGVSCAYTYFDPGQKGTLEVSLGRLGYMGPALAGRVLLQVGTVHINAQDQSAPSIGKVYKVLQVVVPNGTTQTIPIAVARTPVRVQLTIADAIPPSGSESRTLGAQVAFKFVPAR